MLSGWNNVSRDFINNADEHWSTRLTSVLNYDAAAIVEMNILDSFQLMSLVFCTAATTVC